MRGGRQPLRERPFKDCQRTARGGAKRKGREEGKETPTKERIKTGARRSHLSGRPRTQINVLGGMGVQGEGRPFLADCKLKRNTGLA